MLRNPSNLLKLIAIVVLFRLFSMIFIPYADTTEPRYAEIARYMAFTGDWITPWFEPDKPFWGKPPLAFWFQALAIKVFGVAEWTARLPSLLVTLLTMWVIFKFAIEYAGKHTAYWAVAIYSTCALTYVTAGAVLTDPYLTLGTVLCMCGLIMPSVRWRIAGFIGLAIGLLAKGPLAFVLVLGPLVMCLIVYRTRFWPSIQKSVWLLGLILVAALVLPWYAMAEIKTPGFLDYFIFGEHFKRYVDPGWSGDFYGSAHVRPYGSIWPLWVMATFPWGVIAIGAAIQMVIRNRAKQYLANFTSDPITFYLICWSLFSLIFFTFAGNILWTYILPAIPPFAILIGKKLADWNNATYKTQSSVICIWMSLVIIPFSIFILTLNVLYLPQVLKTEKILAQYPIKIGMSDQELWYVDKRPFSARYYSNGRAKLVVAEEFDQTLKEFKREALFIAVPIETSLEFEQRHLKNRQWELMPLGNSRRYELIHLHLGSKTKCFL